MSTNAVDAATSNDGPATCSDPDPPAGSVCPVEVRGRVVDEAGAPIDSLVVSVCAGLCFFGSTDAAGSFSVTPDAHIVVDSYALELHGRPDRISYYTPLPAGSTPLSFTTALPLPRLPSSGVAIVGDGTAQSVVGGDITLSIGAGTKALFNVEDFGIEHGHDLRVVPIASPTSLPFVDAAHPPRALWALAPFETGFSAKVPVTLANTTALAAGTAVELQVMGGLVLDSPPAGHLVHAAFAHVSPDGKTITTDPGEGIVELTFIALEVL